MSYQLESHPLFSTIMENKLNWDDIITLGTQAVMAAKKCTEVQPASYSHDSASLDRLNRNVEKLCDSFASSSKKGSTTETIILRCLVDQFPDAEIDSSRYAAGRGDISFRLDGITMSIEIKNYQTNLPSAEIAKFEKSLLSNKFNVGILASCCSGIVGIKSRFSYKKIGDTLAIFLGNAGIDGVSIVWAIVFGIVTIKMCSAAPSDEKKYATIVAHLQTKIGEIQRCAESINSLSETISTMKSSIVRAVESSTQSLELELNKNKAALRRITGGITAIIAGDNIEEGSAVPQIDFGGLQHKTIPALISIADQLGVSLKGLKRKADIVNAIQSQTQSQTQSTSQSPSPSHSHSHSQSTSQSHSQSTSP